MLLAECPSRFAANQLTRSTIRLPTPLSKRANSREASSNIRMSYMPVTPSQFAVLRLEKIDRAHRLQRPVSGARADHVLVFL